MRAIIATLLLLVVAVAQTEVTSTNFPRPSGASAFRVYTCSDPAANTEFTCTVPTNKIWRVVSLQVALVTDANVANRQVNFLVDDGTNVFLRTGAGSNITAGLTTNLNLSDSGFSGTLIGAHYMAPIPRGLMLGPGYRIRSTTSAIQATDNYGAPVVLVEEWNK